MSKRFLVEDEVHAEPHGWFRSLDAALEELRRLADTPWDQEPNRAPCMGWRTCHRDYVVVEYDDSATPWQEIGRRVVFEISAEGVVWADEFSK